FRPSDLAIPAIWLITALTCSAQPSPAPPPPQPRPQDPLISLMLAQPKIDIESPVVATATFDPPSVRPGEESLYRVSMNALEESVEWPEKLKAAPELEMRPGARGQMLQPGPVFQPRTSFNYRVKATALGEFTIPEFVVNISVHP